ncbi:MAG: hypothetical protein M0Z59_05050 [Nitrospiraceae bacterium]|nr:hypothetical protein [Nitrospiraceae bacterium]
MDRIRFFFAPAIAALLFFSGAGGRAFALDFPPKGVELNGFLQGNYSLDTARRNPDGGSFKLAEERVQLKLDADKDPFRVFLKGDFFHDWIDSRKFDSELREGYAEYTSGKWDARLGRQIITWGVGDLIFINDVFPKDYAAFFSGRPLEYLKKGVDGVKFGIYPGFASFEVVAIPFFTPNVYPSPQKFWMFDPMPQIAGRPKEEPATSLRNTEAALRAYREVAGFDTSVYFYRGFFRQPSAIPDNPLAPSRLDLIFPRLSVYGASAQGRAFFDGVLSLEAGYYDSRDDESGTNPFIPNSQTRFLIGYQRQLGEDLTASVQYYAEYMHNYSRYVSTLPAGLPKARRLYELTSLRLTQLLRHQTLRLSWFMFYSPSEGDFMLNPEVKYSFTDNIWAALGANVFGGGHEYTQFGQFGRDDNTYVQMRYEF